MKVWVVGCVLLFLLVEFYQWAKGFILSLPLYIFAGVLLSITSNYYQDMSNLFARNEQVYQTASLTDIPPILTAENAITSLEAADQKIVKSGVAESRHEY
ncbi:MAG: hypothetical protein IM504_06545 [Microcystis sp. M038S2]|jgi:hypothetical protein|uniref:Uncharacterized protein n=1 Tax=Microcystis aeruginosa G11-04 TaxID=2685956 RepID=A0A966L643_MICAE|nr:MULTISPECIES: hypothetical protein [unclassified Microcystis]NCR27687.1 hypothetical protein [Microcystis aeruginosa LE13-04]NCS12734.1 hypothetical protein [Microcystis aeruginosa G13-09]NCS58132.1 hypothetical protein [Microcystis aeruginosa G11-04]NCT44291.1 hypothetical protein [Microcystis aeruginosa G11-09]TRU63347.1 MAG: hypothetical protein EWV48_07795 [Microcystis aeruginosa Ma_QC_C_20070823_S13]TRU63897.1 MAG: hypothetical protein EWV56_04180 [Microcystis aeruginosa Ma_QC_C_20070